jgi:hypothetical protein
MGFKIIKDTLTPGLKSYFKRIGISRDKAPEGAHKIAMVKTGMMILNWMNNGSANCSTVPPIRSGMLRGSGSVFVGNECVHTSKGDYPAGTPNVSYDAGRNNIAVGYNTAYAARMHETTWVPGGKIPGKAARNNPNITGDVGNKWMEKHLIADKESIMRLYAMELKKESGA